MTMDMLGATMIRMGPVELRHCIRQARDAGAVDELKALQAEDHRRADNRSSLMRFWRRF